MKEDDIYFSKQEMMYTRLLTDLINICVGSKRKGKKKRINQFRGAVRAKTNNIRQLKTYKHNTGYDIVDGKIILSFD